LRVPIKLHDAAVPAHVPLPAKRPPVAAILFDLDDTLWPITPVIIRAEQVLFDWIRTHAAAVAERHSIESMRARRSELMREHPALRADLVALRHQCLAEAFSASGVALSKVDEAMRVFTRARNQVALFSDVGERLPRLSQRIRIGSLTNGAADLGEIGLADHFEVTIAAHQLGTTKPDPAIFHAACEALGLAPAQVAYVGDDLQLDVEGAQKAGLTGLWMNRSRAPIPAELAHIRPDHHLFTLHDLWDWLNVCGCPD
jgi:putative hydrolase of the HAD superfamily